MAQPGCIFHEKYFGGFFWDCRAIAQQTFNLSVAGSNPVRPTFFINRMAIKVDVSNHVLIPKHEVLSEEEKKKVISDLKTSLRNFPKILKGDPALVSLEANVGDLIKITRSSVTSGTSIFYRVVVDV